MARIFRGVRTFAGAMRKGGAYIAGRIVDLISDRVLQQSALSERFPDASANVTGQVLDLAQNIKEAGEILGQGPLDKPPPLSAIPVNPYSPSFVHYEVWVPYYNPLTQSETRKLISVPDDGRTTLGDILEEAKQKAVELLGVYVLKEHSEEEIVELIHTPFLHRVERRAR